MNLKVDFAAGGIVIDSNKILLVKNRKSEYVDDPKSFWGFPKGHMEDGETPKDAAKREVEEETGFIVELTNEKPLAESRYEILVNKEKVKKTHAKMIACHFCVAIHRTAEIGLVERWETVLNSLFAFNKATKGWFTLDHQAWDTDKLLSHNYYSFYHGLT